MIMIMRTTTIKSLLVFSIAVGLVSCLKKDAMVIDTDKGPKSLVEFANTGNNVASASSTYPRFNMDLGSIAPGATVEFNVNVSYSGAEVAPQDINVDLALDPDALTKFNTENSTNYVVPPSDIFELPTNVVIQKGTHQSQIKVKVINNASFDFSKSYAIPLKIASASNAAVSGNFGKALYSFGARNSYDGVYAYSGEIWRNTATGPDMALSGPFDNLPARSLATLSANSVSLVPLWANGGGIGGIDGTYITVDPVTNDVTVASSNATMKNTPGEVNHYDPATKTFNLAFDWGTAPNTRVTKIKLVYLRPR
jgi:hypothetical protein